jgi:hypothetical protein
MMCVWRLDRGFWHGTGDEIECFTGSGAGVLTAFYMIFQNTQDNEMIKENSLTPHYLSHSLLCCSLDQFLAWMMKSSFPLQFYIICKLMHTGPLLNEERIDQIDRFPVIANFINLN